MTVYPSRTISVSIDRDWREVYDFTSIPENFQRWAAGLGRRFDKSGEEWLAEDPDGRTIRIRFARPNELGVLDHVVHLEADEILIAMRVVPNATGAEVMLTILQLPGMTEERFAADAAAVERDLTALKRLLER
jgi:hypothetical protein